MLHRTLFSRQKTEKQKNPGLIHDIFPPFTSISICKSQSPELQNLTSFTSSMAITLVQTIIIVHCNYCNSFPSGSCLVSFQFKMLSQIMFLLCSVPSTGSSSHSEQNPNMLPTFAEQALCPPLTSSLSPSP